MTNIGVKRANFHFPNLLYLPRINGFSKLDTFYERIVMLLLLFLQVCSLSAQEKGGETIGEKIVANAYNADSVRAVWDKMPYFTLFKDNYFIGGTTLGGKPTSVNSDVKFQLSIAQRLTKSKLPFDTYLFIQYTQKAFGMFSGIVADERS